MCWPVIDPLGRYQHAKQLKEAGDAARPRPQLDRFVTRYRQAGGQVEVELLEGESEGFMTRNPNSDHRVRSQAARVTLAARPLPPSESAVLTTREHRG